MSATVINLIIQLISGAAGGHALAGMLKNLDLGPLGNTIAGALGGGLGGQLLTSLLGGATIGDAGAAANNLDIGSILGQIVGGGASGGILTAIIGAIRQAMSGGDRNAL